MSKKPNIVFISADQWRGDCLGLYANEHPVMTPHINQLAAEGTLYTQAYADCPICMPQRMTMLTGKTGTELGVVTNFSTRPTVSYNETLPYRLSREAGYQTKAVGKMHFMPQRGRYGFDHVTLHPDDYINWLEDTPYAGTFRGHGLGGNELYPAVAPMPDKYYHSTWIIDQSINFLDQRDPDDPFFLYMVFEAPHSPFDPPAPYDRMYDNFTISDPVKGDWCDNDMPPAFQAARARRKNEQLQPEVIRESRRRYYGQISHIDYHLGRLFGALRTRGLDGNTVIVFTSDHGELIGDHGLGGKFCFLQGGGRVPLALRVPGTVQLPQVDDPVLTADICPTLLELAGLEADSELQGTSLLRSTVEDGAFASRITIGETPGSYCSMDRQHKYIFYPDGGTEQLFDLQNDPNDEHNLIRDTSLSAERDTLKNALVRYLEQHDRPAVANGKLKVNEAEPDLEAARRGNPWACRGPMRYGMGY